MKRNKNSKAVSPVLSSILLVAISVVMVAVLFVMVNGFGGNKRASPSGAWTHAVIKDQSTENVYLTQFDPDTRWSDCRLVVENLTANATSPTDYTFSLSYSNGSITGSKVGAGNPGYAVSGTDLAKDDKISTGDYITISRLPTGRSYIYRLTLIFAPLGSSVCDITFTR